jgi:cytochrome c peroxidase
MTCPRFHFRLRFAAALSGLLVPAAAVAVIAFQPLPASPPIPADNPQTPAKIELGKQLFFDPRLSATGTVSCNSCHNVMEAGEDDRAVSVGVKGQLGKRSAPTIWNAAYLSSQFWDGRAATLEEQAKGPLVNPIEMGMPSHQVVVGRLAQIPGYQKQFQSVFGGKEPITIDNVARAIASYERTLVTPNSAFDRYQKGDHSALSAAAVRGMDLVGELGCTACHSGAMFAGPVTQPGAGVNAMKFPARVTDPYVVKYRLAEDLGRYALTNDPGDLTMWRVPTWRNVARTAPYFHNGAVPTLDEAVRVMARVQLGRTLNQRQVGEIVAFLGSLNGEYPQQTLPRLPELTGQTLIQ